MTQSREQRCGQHHEDDKPRKGTLQSDKTVHG